jgi:hypothetical protein
LERKKERNFNSAKENLRKANDFMNEDEFLKLPQDSKLFSKKKPCGKLGIVLKLNSILFGNRSFLRFSSRRGDT